MSIEYCEHDDCREETARELMRMAAVLSRGDLAELSIESRIATVRCRRERKPRRALCGTGVMAPLP